MIALGKKYGCYLNVRCKATFVPNICGILTILFLDYTLHIKSSELELHVLKLIIIL
jgi:hypothetical protein